MNLTLNGNTLLADNKRVGDLNIVGETAYIDNIEQNVLLYDSNPFPYKDVNDVNGKFCVLTHKGPESDEDSDILLFERIYADDKLIALSKMVALDVKKGQFKVEVEIVDPQFSIEIEDYEINSPLPDLAAEEIVVSFYLATEQIILDITLK